MAQIEVKDLTFYYDDFYHRVFEHLNVNLDTDWKMALVGRNGRGKTTLLHLLEGRLEPTDGVIRRRGTVKCAHRLQAFRHQQRCTTNL